MLQGFLLGLANGTVCIAYCAPVLVPYLLGEGKGVGRNFLTLGEFLFGRLVGYLAFAFLAWGAHVLVWQHIPHREMCLGVVYIILALFMFYYGFGRETTQCAAGAMKGIWSRISLRNPWLLPLLFGFLTGLNLCPPFLLAFIGAFSF